MAQNWFACWTAFKAWWMLSPLSDGRNNRFGLECGRLKGCGLWCVHKNAHLLAFGIVMKSTWKKKKFRAGRRTPSQALMTSLQDALVELSEHGIVIIVEERGCLQARVYFRKELFRSYEYNAEVRPRFGVSLGLFVDCLNTFTSSGGTTALELRYPGSDMQLLLRLIDLHNACIYAEIRTRIPDTIPWDYNFENTGRIPVSFAVKSAALKEAIDDLEWPGSSIQLSLNPDPPVVTFRGEGHGDLQIDFFYNAQADLFIAFQCDHYVSYRYKYKFLRATTANIPTGVLKDNRGSKITVGRGGLLKIQHLVSVRPQPGQQQPIDPSGNQQQHGRISYIEFYVKPEEDDEDANGS